MPHLRVDGTDRSLKFAEVLTNPNFKRPVSPPVTEGNTVRPICSLTFQKDLFIFCHIVLAILNLIICNEQGTTFPPRNDLLEKNTILMI
jgi:hypothetical protein